MDTKNDISFDPILIYVKACMNHVVSSIESDRTEELVVNRCRYIEKELCIL